MVSLGKDASHLKNSHGLSKNPLGTASTDKWGSWAQNINKTTEIARPRCTFLILWHVILDWFILTIAYPLRKFFELRKAEYYVALELIMACPANNVMAGGLLKRLVALIGIYVFWTFTVIFSVFFILKMDNFVTSVRIPIQERWTLTGYIVKNGISKSWN